MVSNRPVEHLHISLPLGSPMCRIWKPEKEECSINMFIDDQIRLDIAYLQLTATQMPENSHATFLRVSE